MDRDTSELGKLDFDNQIDVADAIDWRFKWMRGLCELVLDSDLPSDGGCRADMVQLAHQLARQGEQLTMQWSELVRQEQIRKAG